MEIGVDGDRFWPWKKEEEEKKEETAEIKEKERKKKEKDILEKETVGKIILKKEYKNIIYIKYSV